MPPISDPTDLDFQKGSITQALREAEMRAAALVRYSTRFASTTIDEYSYARGLSDEPSEEEQAEVERLTGLKEHAKNVLNTEKSATQNFVDISPTVLPKAVIDQLDSMMSLAETMQHEHADETEGIANKMAVKRDELRTLIGS